MTRFFRVVLALVVAVSLPVGPVSAATAGTARQLVAATTGDAVLTGIATDGSGNPVSGAHITLTGSLTKTATTDGAGTYTFTDIPAGVYSVAASKAGYETAVTQDVAIAAGTKTLLNVQLVVSSLQSLRLIGTTRTTASRGGFNTSGLSVTTLDNSKIVARVQPNLKDLVSEMPGVVSSRDSGGRTPNSSFIVRGSQLETKVNIDGHGVSSGVFGTYNTNYANSEIFEQVEVLKGAGLNGPNAGESAIGTINLRTRNFSAKNEWGASVTADSYGSGYYQFHVNQNLFHDRFQLLVARSYQGYKGPDQGINGLNISGVGGSGNVGYSGLALPQWVGELSNPYSTLAELVKARYKFSNSSWLTGEFLNLTGRYTNQGGSYAINYGKFPVAQCYNGTQAAGTFIASGQAGCTPASTYGPPNLMGLIGSTQTMYSYFPRSYVLNQEPQFSLEFRTTFKNDTIFIRPYQAEIKRFIDGSLEDTTPGYGFGGGAPNGWFQVTNPANCQVAFAKPGAGTAGAKGPCFSGADNYQTPYVGTPLPGQFTIFPTTPTAPACSVASPCYTTQTNQQRNGVYAFNTPFSQPEVDRTHGVTFSWIHPVRDNVYSFNVDYSTDNTLKFSGDTSAVPAGCFPTVANVPNTPTVTVGGVVQPNPYYQPNCQIGGVIYATTPRNSLQIPPTTNYKTDYSLTGLFQVTPKLQLGIGNYLTVQRMDYQYTDPAAAAAAANLGLNGAEPADATLLHGIATHVHYDPHFQAQYRLNRDVSLRANAGSSITTPYAGVVSGFTRLGVNAGPDGKSDVLTVPNAQLLPETTVAYDAGLDARLRDGSIISADAFDNTIHNVFVTFSQNVPNLPGRAPSQTIQTTTINGPIERAYGLELTAQKAPAFGWGYYATATAQRAYYDQFSNAFYQGLAAAGNANFIAIVNGKQLDATTGFTGQIPYFKGKAEANYMFRDQRAYLALGVVHNGNNNPYGTNAFNTVYANGFLNLGHGLQLQVAGENLLNFNAGGFTGNTIYGTGFSPIGVKYSAATGGLIYGPASIAGNNPTGANNVVIVKPANFYVTLTKKI